MPSRFLLRLQSGLMAVLVFCASAPVRCATPPSCQRATLDGEVSAGQEWKTSIGGGWLFRIVPISAGETHYSGWDLVVDRERPAGFPDALYLATPPYGSISEREIGTTFGLRAQDAMGWNPRTFRFLVEPRTFTEAQKIYRSAFQSASGPAGEKESAVAHLLSLQKSAASGELRILDARFVPGTADPAAFAQQWAQAASRAGYDIESAPAGQSSAAGALRWMRFRVTLWLPADWKVAPHLHVTRTACDEVR